MSRSYNKPLMNSNGLQLRKDHIEDFVLVQVNHFISVEEIGCDNRDYDEAHETGSNCLLAVLCTVKKTVPIELLDN